MKTVAIAEFPGSHGKTPLHEALDSIGGLTINEVWHSDDSLGSPDIVFVPGGSAFGDLVRPGALAKTSPLAAGLRKYDQEGGRIVGFGNGFQILCEVGVLPGVLLLNKSGSFISQLTLHNVVNAETNFTKNLDPKKIYSLPLACRYGRYYVDRRTLKDMEENGQIAMRYCDQFGEFDVADPFNGCVEAIAGVTNLKKNAFGMMAHPERALSARSGGTDGLEFLRAILKTSSAV